MLFAESVALPITPEGKVNILLVDDQAESLIAHEAVLEALGQNLIKAKSGREALWHLLHEDFAVILLDVQMPDMDGFEVAALIRERDKSRHTPIIFMTAAFKSDTQVFKGYEMGAVDYILKPIVPNILRSKVSVFVELAKKTDMILRQAGLLREAETREHAKQMADAMAFSHAVSHDLRAPLRHIESFSEILLRDYADRLDDQGRDYLRRLSGSARKMMSLIDAMLMLSEATQSEISREVVDLSRLAESLSAELRRAEPRREVEFVIQEGLTAAGDPQLLRLVLENLLRNAWKYTGKRPQARIEFGKTSRDAEETYYVRDNGVGFDMAHADKLFQPFSRLHARGDFEGSGLGLATVQRVILRHGGSISGEGQVSRGATFYFTLAPPRKTDAPPALNSARATRTVQPS